MLYYGRLRLVYNDGDSVESEPFIALVPRPSSAVGWAVPPDGLGDPEFRRCLERKARDVEEILRRPGLRSKSTRAYAGFPNELRNEVQAFDAREKRDQERWTREFAVRGARPREIKLEGSPLGLVVDGATAWVSTGSTNKVARIDLKRATVTSLINLAWPVPVALTGNALWVRTGDPGGGHERIVRVDRDSNRVQPARPPLALRDRFAARPESFPYVATRRRLTRFDRKGEKVLRSAQLPHGSSALNIYRSVATGSGAVWVSDGNGMIRFDPTTLRAEHRIELGFAPSSITAGESLVWARGSRFVGKGRIEPASRLYRVQGVNEKLVRTSALKSACCVVFRRGLAWFVRPYLKGAEVTAVDAYGRTTRSMLVPTPKPSDVALTSDGIAVTGEGVVSLLTITSP